MSKHSWLLPALLTVAACGPKPGTVEPTETPAPPASDGPAPVETSPPPDEGAARAKHKAAFMSGCQKSPDLKPFCECSFEVTVETLTPEELETEKVSTERMDQLKLAMGERCSEKLPEEALRQGFLSGCNAKSPALGGFCDCAWSELRKSASPAQIANMQGSPQLKQATAACIPKIEKKQLSADLKSGFMKGCVKNPEAQKFCDCAWKTFSSAMTPVEMVLEGPKSERNRAALEKLKTSCAKLKPKSAEPAPTGS